MTKTIVAVLDNQPTKNSSLVLCDATASPDQLAKVLGQSVVEITPSGYIEIQNRTVQIARDITRQTSSDVFKGLIRAVMASRSKHHRVGVICHRMHIEHLRNLGKLFERRIVKAAYFGSGEDRSSNKWHRTCDLLIVAGTPRVKPEEIRFRLFQIGDIEAASREPEWGLFRWRGLKESGEKIIIDGLGYAYDPDWRDAQRAIVRANIVQAVGRGRGILPDGCDVILLSTEESGILLADDQDIEPMTDSECTVFSKTAEITELSPIDNIIGSSSVNSPRLAALLGLSDRQVRKHLTRLERRGLVCRVGQRSGWKLADSGFFPTEGGAHE